MGKSGSPIHDRRREPSAAPKECWFNATSERIVVLGPTAAIVIGCTPRLLAATEADVLVGADARELRFLKVWPTGQDELLVLYELGMLVIASDGSMRWHRLHEDVSSRLIGMDSTSVTIESQWPPEVAGRRSRYRLMDGVRVDEA